MWHHLLIDYVQYLNFFPQRAPRMMWLLGAGASVSSGLPTAGTLIWDFKRQIYCNANRISASRFQDLDDPSFQNEVQAYFASQPGTPELWANDEYSYYFERYLPDESDRHRFLKDRLRGTQPSHGHLCLAALMGLQKTRIVWTTNFDSLIERGYQTLQAKQTSISEITMGSLLNPDVLTHCIKNEDWPIVVKLHGDFQYVRLKNTTQELKTQDAILRKHLVKLCKEWGLSVVGYSGRDESVMEALAEAADSPDSYPHGLYWFIQSGATPAPAVIKIIEQVKANGSPAAIIEIGGFDELMEDLFLPHQEELPDVRDLVKSRRPHRRPVDSNYGNSTGWPLIRTNALEISEYPATCRIFECQIGGSREVNELITGHRHRITASRRKEGVIAFATKEDILSIFADKGPSRFDVHPIEPRRFYYDSHELGMFYDAVCQGIATTTGLIRLPNKKGRILYFPEDFVLSDAANQGLNVKPVSQPRRPGPFYHQAFAAHLDYRDKRLWFLIEPTIVLTSDGQSLYTSTDKHTVIKDYLAERYNSVSNRWLDFWIKFLFHHLGNPIQISFPDNANPEAQLKLSVNSAWSRPS
jgi:NAD-dependent SIR2 family protein deacetylase